jgi:glycosyltransferase involved in cell wall biosynthesis
LHLDIGFANIGIMSMLGVFAEISGLPVVFRPDGSLVLTRKFIEGMTYYAEHWPGPAVAVLQPSTELSSNLDNVEVRPDDLPFSVKGLRYDSAELRTYLATCGFVHWGPHHRLHDLADVLAQAKVPNVFCTEYSFQTRRQIIAAECANPLIRLRRYLSEWKEDRHMRRSISKATGLETNGTPTLEDYGSLNANRLLFFDTRTTVDLLATSPELENRLNHLESSSRSLHLVFSGRLNRMKGALDLIAVAEELRRSGVDFHLSICGGGVVEDEMRERIAQNGLTSRVTMKGFLDFEKELVPFVQSQADIFLCCHKQGDPSCTYLETFACGVPIAGYLNEALSGLLKRVDAGWGVPLNEPKALAALVTQLVQRRSEIADKSRRALAFARANTFELTFEHRVAFFKQCAMANASSDAVFAEKIER